MADLHILLLQNVWVYADERYASEKALCQNVDVHKRSKLTDACFWRVENMELQSIFAEMSGGCCTVQMRDIQGVVHIGTPANNQSSLAGCLGKLDISIYADVVYQYKLNVNLTICLKNLIQVNTRS